MCQTGLGVYLFSVSPAMLSVENTHMTFAFYSHSHEHVYVALLIHDMYHWYTPLLNLELHVHLYDMRMKRILIAANLCFGYSYHATGSSHAYCCIVHFPILLTL